MGGWSSAARQDGWGHHPQNDTRGEPGRGRSQWRRRGWTPADVAVLVGAFVVRWELGLAFLALKLWHQASDYPGGTLSFARMKWDALVTLTRRLIEHGSLPFAFQAGPKSSGNLAFDAWRRGELDRIEAERRKLQVAEQDFTRYRDDLLQARDREAFDRFMNQRTDRSEATRT